MKLFTNHTQQQGITYIEHWYFAMSIACRLLSSAIAFAVHAIFPFINIDVTLDLEATINFLQERNHWIESTKLKEQKKPIKSDPLLSL